MNKSKARLIFYYSYESFKILMLMVSAVKKLDDKGEELPVKKETILYIAGKIVDGIHFRLYEQFDELREELDYLEEIRKRKEKELVADINIETFAYLSVVAFKKLGGVLVPDFLDKKSNSKLELELREVVIEQSEKIIKEIISPLMKKYPNIKEEMDLAINRYIKFI